jgi:hypothetical protein
MMEDLMGRFSGRSAKAAAAARVAVAAAAMATMVLGTGGAAVAASGSVSQAHSSIFAGYAVSKPTAHVKHVTASFVVPTITCESSFSGVGPSVLVYSKVNPVTGKHLTSGAGLGIACENGNPLYESVIIVNGKATNDVTLQPGDVVDVDVHVVPTGTTVTVFDDTTSMQKTRTGAGHTAVQSFIGDNNVVVDGVSGTKLDPFTSTEITDVRVNGNSLGSQSPVRYQWVRQGTTLVSTGGLVGGTAFTMTYRHS